MEDTNTMLKDIEKAYKDVQDLQLQPTKHNLLILASIVNCLEKSYQYVKSKRQEETKASEEVISSVEGTEADS